MYTVIAKKINTIDLYILSFITKRCKNRYLDITMPIVTKMGNLGLVWILMGLALIADRPYRAIGNLVLLTLIISTAFGEGIVKHIVKRVRPCELMNSMLLIDRPITYSFPSGHTFSSFAVAEVLSMYFYHYRPLFLGLAILIAFSRLYLNVHYPTDVMAGIVLGIICSKIIFMM